MQVRRHSRALGGLAHEVEGVEHQRKLQHEEHRVDEEEVAIEPVLRVAHYGPLQEREGGSDKRGEACKRRDMNKYGAMVSMPYRRESQST